MRPALDGEVGQQFDALVLGPVDDGVLGAGGQDEGDGDVALFLVNPEVEELPGGDLDGPFGLSEGEATCQGA